MGVGPGGVSRSEASGCIASQKLGLPGRGKIKRVVSTRMLWAELIKRVFLEDVLCCPCVVAGNAGEQPNHQRVVFAGEEMTLSAAGRRALHEQGFTLGRVRGTRCWEYEGRLLESLLLDLEIGKTSTP